MKRLKNILPFFIVLSIFGMVFLYYYPFYEEHKMKLINITSKFVIAEYNGGKTIIHDRLLRKEMMIRGVVIPPALRLEYGGKAVVRLNEKEFQKAFKELYSNQAFNSKNYRWEE
jgi:hypothetical protein